MSLWEQLRLALTRLRRQVPCPLVRYPMMDAGAEPPFSITLAPWAVAVAEELYRQFGEYLDLTVGVLPYPPGRRGTSRRYKVGRPAQLLDPREAAAELDGPAVVVSGHTLRHGLVLSNHAGRELQIATNGQLTAAVVDPQTGEIVGGFSGTQRLPLVVFRVPSGQQIRIPLLIGTASFMSHLGYAVPAGDWGAQATLTIGPDPADSPRRRTPVLPLSIIEQEGRPT